MFLECFPRLEAAVAARRREPPAGRPQRRPDRAVRARSTSPSAGPRGCGPARCSIDLKTGGFSPSHREDLRFYALVETLRLGVPPRLLGQLLPRRRPPAAGGGVARTLLRRAPSSGWWTAADAVVALRHEGREPRAAAGAAVPLVPAPARTCEVGQRYLERDEPTDADGGW